MASKPFLPTASTPVNNTGAEDWWTPAPTTPAPRVIQAPPATVGGGGWEWANPANWSLPKAPWATWLNPQSWTMSEGAVPLPSVQTQEQQATKNMELGGPAPQWTLDQIPKWNAPDEQKAALAAAGMDYGQAAPQKAEPLSLVDMNKASVLTEHTYNISDRDWSAIQRTNGQWVDPAKNPAPQLRTGWDQSAPMTEQAYANLTDAQRRAVDFNTLLVDARERDLNLTKQLSGAELEAYNNDVKNIFGEGGGSSVVAPATVKMLKSLGMELQGQDLDDFLSGEAGVQLNELLDFDLPQTPNMIMKPTGQGGMNQDLVDFSYTRSAENRDRVTAVAINKAGELIDVALKRQDIARPDWLGTVQQGMGYAVDPKTLPVGWGVPETRTDKNAKAMEVFYNGVYTYLADANTQDLNRVWSELNARKFSEKDIDDLFKYIDERSAWEIRTGGSSGTRSGAEVRKLAQLDGGTDGQG